MASAQEGLHAEITPFPQGGDANALDARPIAHIRFVVDDTVARDPLFAHVLERRSNKEPYDLNRPLPSAGLEAMKSAAGPGVQTGATNNVARVAAFRDLTWEALRIEMLTPYTMQESIDLMRIGKQEINENPDGITLGGALFDTAKLLGLMSRESMADPNSTGFQEGLRIWEETARTAMGYIWVITPGNTRFDQLNAGRAWVRMNLKGMDEGIGLHPMSQLLQEYPEMAELYAQIHQELGATGSATVQMFGRCGYGPEMPRSPRWPVGSKIVGQ